MPYKYFNEGLNGEAGTHADAALQRGLEANLSGVFQYPLLSDRSPSDPDDIELPERAFHVVQVQQTHLHSFEELQEFEALLAEIPHDLDVILDMNSVSYVDSEALGKLIKLHKAMESKSCRLYIATSQSRVLEKFATTQLDRMMQIRKSTQDAYQKLLATAA